MRITTRRVTLAIAMMTVLVVGTGVYSEETEIGVYVGQMAPDFTLPEVGTEEDVTLSEEVAKYDVTVLYFFYAAS